MTEDERLIDEVAESVDPMLRWLAVWHADGYPVDVNGERQYLNVGSPVLFTGQGHMQVQDKRNHSVGRVDGNGDTFFEHIAVTVVKITDVTIPAPEHIMERVSKIFG